MSRRWLTTLSMVALSSSGCGSDADREGADTVSDAAPEDEGDAAIDAPDEADAAGDGEAEIEVEVDVVEVEAETGDADRDTVAIEGPGTPGARAFREVRLIAHLHSAYSHDGCDDHGLDADGVPNAACIARMKAALCAEHIGHVYMTDHPAFSSEQPWRALFYADEGAGDTFVVGDDGEPWAVRFACPPGEGGPDGRTTLMVGFEGTHTMPLGLKRPFEWEASHAFEDAADDALLEGVTAAVEAAGGHLAIAHSEEDDLSAQTIERHAVAAMELYNFHANFKEVLGGSGIGPALFALDAFIDPDAAVPDPNLAALILFAEYPEAALTKWRAVSAARAITGFAGADAHENVSFAAACVDNPACDTIAVNYPNLVAYLKVGGPLWQSDGQRLDGYARVFRWVQNRVYVAPGDDPADPLTVERAFFAGQSAVVFEVLGEPPGFALVLEASDGTLHEIGASVARDAAGMTLWARSPEAPAPTRYATWTDGAAAAIEARVWRTTAAGSEAIATWTEPGTWRAIAIDDASDVGAYQLEVVVTPRHLVPVLGSAGALGDGTYRWVETNAIRVE